MWKGLWEVGYWFISRVLSKYDVVNVENIRASPWRYAELSSVRETYVEMMRHTDVDEGDNLILLVELLPFQISYLQLKMIQCRRRKDLSRTLQGDGLDLRKALVLISIMSYFSEIYLVELHGLASHVSRKCSQVLRQPPTETPSKSNPIGQQS